MDGQQFQRFLDDLEPSELTVADVLALLDLLARYFAAQAGEVAPLPPAGGTSA